MSKEKPLKEVIDKLLRAYGYQDQLDEIDLINAYEDITGKMFANHTKQIYYKNKILYVYLDSAALKQELSYMKTTVILKLNQVIGRKIVEDIVIK
jgi:predicted nucleic acid-binding Zn ribbon protein